jgi:hypothetical protein
MSDYKMNRPIIADQETLWYRTLRAIYKANKPLHKKEWLKAANVKFSEESPIFTTAGYGITKSRWPYRHWRGLYPAMFKHFQRLKLVNYNCKEKKWSMNRLDYKIFCLSLNIKP